MTQKFLCILIVIFHFVGCTGAFITAPEPTSPELSRLLNANQRKISLSIKSLETSKTYGSQYLLIALPLTQIEIEDPISELKAAFTLALAQAGYRLSNDISAPTLEVTLSSLSLQGYDYLFFRRPWCEAEIEARLINSYGSLLAYAAKNESHGEYSKFAFEPELSRVLRKTLEINASQIISDLHL